MPTKAKGSETGESPRALAVANFAVPVTLAWLSAVAGLATWDKQARDLFNNIGQLAVAAGVGVAFATVVLSAVQDMLPLRAKQWLLFPRGVRGIKPGPGGTKPRRHSYPSYWAFSDAVAEKAELKPFSGLDALQRNPERQNEVWDANFTAYRDAPAIGHFRGRHIAWRDLIPVLIVLTVATPLAGILLEPVVRERCIVASCFFLFEPLHLHRWLFLTLACAVLLVGSWFAGRRSNVSLVITVLEEARRHGLKMPPPPGRASPSKIAAASSRPRPARSKSRRKR
ncbi:MAG TPA: hypothetical protein VE989_01305 [Sphingomicrobium sp.]|nr:hypothetical protein [Sphingomicrobium sp.]